MFMSEHSSSHLMAQISDLTSEVVDVAKHGLSRFSDTVKVNRSPSTIDIFLMMLANFIVVALSEGFLSAKCMKNVSMMCRLFFENFPICTTLYPK